MGSKWEIEKFTGKNDFGLWKVKVRAILTQQKCVEALLGISNMPNTLSNAEKSEMNDKALSVIILCLADNVLREVAKEKTAAAMWTKLDALYMTKSLAHKQCLKERLFFFRMVENKPVVEQLSEFNKIIDDLANIDVNLEDEDKAFHLLCALPKSLENLKDALLYGKEGTITLDEVQSALRTKELTNWESMELKSWTLDAPITCVLRKEYFEALELVEGGVCSSWRREKLIRFKVWLNFFHTMRGIVLELCY
ncbi:unnamed protein product [Trifolium pratense]|uniref:Uncharacterized protein n=1 Tax=Trifolium pratense TaxID=57577 RepID=A0ACB0JS56_TRIPR|nr:unnamed protein product [Trifolium pratense]